MVRKVILTGKDKDGNDVQVPWLFSENGSMVTDPSVNKIIDTNADGYTYTGLADPGTLTSASLWQIQRYNNSGFPIVTQWADGNADYDNVWDDRTSGSYS